MQNKSSRTAEQVALFRALESVRDRDRLFDDPYAAKVLRGWYRLVARLARARRIGRWLEQYIDKRWPAGPRASAVVRTRLIDDLVGAALAGGARQVLLLGAGYDSRAYRLPAMAAARVFEVDHPATQAAKRRLIGAHVLPDRRDHVRFVPVDLNRDDLADALREAGFAALDRTVVVWEGVTNYLTGEAVDATLRRIAGITGSGSRLILTYVNRDVVEGRGGREADCWRSAVGQGGEPWTFGFRPAELSGYLSERGMALRLDMSARDAAQRYLAPLGRSEPTATFYRIAEAEVR